MRRDLPLQVRTRFGEPMRTIRDPPNNRLPALGPVPPRQRRRLMFFVGTRVPTLLCRHFFGRLPDPLRSLAPPCPRVRWSPTNQTP